MKNTHLAQRAGSATPTNDKASGANAGLVSRNQRNNNTDSAASVIDGKAFSTLRAQLAIRGVALKRLPGGGFLVRSWGMGRVLPDLQAVEAFAKKVGA